MKLHQRVFRLDYHLILFLYIKLKQNKGDKSQIKRNFTQKGHLSMIRVIVLFIFLSSSTGAFAQLAVQKVFAQKMDLPESRDIGTQVLRMGESFLGTPYVAGTLEGNPTERLVC